LADVLSDSLKEEASGGSNSLKVTPKRGTGVLRVKGEPEKANRVEKVSSIGRQTLD